MRTSVARSVLVFVVGLTVAAALARAQSKDKPPPAHGEGAKSALPHCPVMGEPVDFTVFTTTKEGPVYFCCSMCISKFEKDPAKYSKGVAEQRTVLAKMQRVQVACPVSKKPVDKTVSVKNDGKDVYFCCKKCPAIYEKDPAKYSKALQESYTYQTRCPVSGKPIDPREFIETKSGQKIYFCCDKCAAALLKDPNKYLPNLAAQGYPVESKDLPAAQAKEPKAPQKSAPNM